MRQITRVVATYADVYWGTPQPVFRLDWTSPKIKKDSPKTEIKPTKPLKTQQEADNSSTAS